MQKIGLLGVGHLGKIHLKCIQMIPEYDFVGFFDPIEESNQIAKEAGVKKWDDLDALLDAVDIIDIVTPTITHYELALRAIEKGKHVFIEKPLTNTIEEAAHLLEKSKEFGVKVQVGHVERFNPALLALGDMHLRPMFIEAHRLAMFNPRGTDVSVVLDLMIHDLDLVLNLVQSKVKFISASGVSVVSKTPDISNARLEFENGCVANLTASRISMKQMRKLRLFQKDAYISLDFLDKNAQVIRLYNQGDISIPEDGNVLELHTEEGIKLVHMQLLETEAVNAIKMELETFARCIREDTRPIVSIEDGYQALSVAHQIIEQIETRTNAIK
jgi:predicted dehydrogenase